MSVYIHLTACRHETTRSLVTHSELPTHDTLRHVISEKIRQAMGRFSREHIPVHVILAAGHVISFHTTSLIYTRAGVNTGGVACLGGDLRLQLGV